MNERDTLQGTPIVVIPRDFQAIQEGYRDHVELWFCLSLAALVGASCALWSERVRARSQPARRLPACVLCAILIVAVWTSPFVAAPLARHRMGTLRDQATEHVGSTPEALVTACGDPDSRSECWLVYRPPWFLLWPVDVRVLVIKERVAIAYLDD